MAVTAERSVGSARLGRSDVDISRLCLGTMTFGRQSGVADAHAILDAAFGLGITSIDTADIYPFSDNDYSLIGRSEEIIGQWLRGRRDDVVLATKFGAAVAPGPGDSGGSRRHVTRALEDSLRRLGTDRIDLYQMHVPDPATPIDETLEALEAAVMAGKVRAIGCSNISAYRLARSLGVSERLGIARFDSVQLRYNALFRQPERDLLDNCHDDDVSVLVYNPLAGGLLTGKYGAGGPPPEGSRYAHEQAGLISRMRYWHDAERTASVAFTALAQEAGVTPATLAIAWLLDHPAVTAPIVGVTTIEQLAPAVAAAGYTLDADLRARIDDLTAEFRRGDAPL